MRIALQAYTIIGFGWASFLPRRIPNTDASTTKINGITAV